MFECKGCQKRYAGCHSKRESYLSEKAKTDATREKRNHENFVVCGVIESNFHRAMKAKKKRRRDR